MASTKTSVAKTKPATGTAVMSWRDRLSAYAKEASAVADEAGGGGGKFVSAKKGKLYFDGQPVAGNVLDVVVTHSVIEHAFYESDYDPDNPQSPVCFAFGSKVSEMAPHEKSLKPQANKCQGCEHNEWGSSDKGKGKACKNIMRLALLPAKPLDAEAIAKAEVAYMKLPVTSVKGFAQYTKRLEATLGLPPFAVVTQLGCVDDDKTQFKITFADTARLDGEDEIMNAIEKHHNVQREAILFPYQPPSEEEKSKAKPKAGAKAKKY